MREEALLKKKGSVRELELSRVTRFSRANTSVKKMNFLYILNRITCEWPK